MSGRADTEQSAPGPTPASPRAGSREPGAAVAPTLPADRARHNVQDTQRLLDHVRSGATLVVSGRPADRLAAVLPWRDPADPASRVGQATDLVLDNGIRLPGGSPTVAGVPTAEAKTLAVWADGRPAAAAAPYGSGCLIYIDTPLEGGSLPVSETFPAALDRLIRGCEDSAGGTRAGARAAGPLDQGARATLRADDLPGTAALAPLIGDSGATSLFRWFLVVAGLVALLETVLAYGSRREGSSP